MATRNKFQTWQQFDPNRKKNNAPKNEINDELVLVITESVPEPVVVEALESENEEEIIVKPKKKIKVTE